MNETVKEWVEKGESDYHAALALNRQRKRKQHDIICFHAQQCVEKLMKAALIRRKVVPPKTQDLVKLDVLLRCAFSDWSADEDELRELSRGAVVFRYPGGRADHVVARKSLAICRKLRAIAATALARLDAPTGQAYLAARMLKRTPFYDFHVSMGGRMVDFAGWEMPIVYRSIIDEHEQTRKRGSIFDVSHMGRMHFSGPDAPKFLDKSSRATSPIRRSARAATRWSATKPAA